MRQVIRPDLGAGVDPYGKYPQIISADNIGSQGIADHDDFFRAGMEIIQGNLEYPWMRLAQPNFGRYESDFEERGKMPLIDQGTHILGIVGIRNQPNPVTLAFQLLQERQGIRLGQPVRL